MQQEDCKSFNVPLMDGRKVDVSTESGANAYLQTGFLGESSGLSDCVERMSYLCANERRLNWKARSDLHYLNMLVALVSRHGSKGVFREHVEPSTVQAWLNYAIGQIRRLSANQDWIANGKIPAHCFSLLDSCYAMMRHVFPISFAFESDFFNVLAEFVKARKGTGRCLPCAVICRKITLIVSSAYNTSTLYADNKWTTEQSLKKLEGTGVLEQLIRCATVPQPHDDRCLFHMLDDFQECVTFIRKNLQPGKPCGDTVTAILEGRDGSMARRPSVLNKLTTMSRFAFFVNTEQQRYNLKKCSNCGILENSEEPLMKCARCQQVYYCSKKCQTADWKVHKQMCFCSTKRKKKLVKSSNIHETLMSFCNFEYCHIMVKLVETCEQTGLSDKDMLVEVSFNVNENGLVPAMQDKPEFKIAPIKDYVEGSRPAEPDWFFKNSNRKEYEGHINTFVRGINEACSNTQPNEILCLTRCGSEYACISVHYDAPFTSKDMFSHEAMLAFKAYIQNGDDNPLSEIFDPGFLRTLKRQLAVYYNYGVPDEEMTRDAAMDGLRMNEEQHGSL